MIGNGLGINFCLVLIPRCSAFTTPSCCILHGVYPKSDVVESGVVTGLSLFFIYFKRRRAVATPLHCVPQVQSGVLVL